MDYFICLSIIAIAVNCCVLCQNAYYGNEHCSFGVSQDVDALSKPHSKNGCK